MTTASAVLAHRAEAALEGTLADIDLVARSDEMGASLGRGRSGLIVLYAHLSRVTGKSKYLDLCVEARNDVAQRITGGMTLSLFSGLTGALWAIAFAERCCGADFPDEPIDLSEVNGLVLDELKTGAFSDNFDLIDGLVGTGLYGLSSQTCRPIAEEVLRQLASTAKQSGSHAYWLTPPHLVPARHRAMFPDGGLNLGLAHGIPGVVGFLAKCALDRDLRSQAEPLLKKVVDWLLSKASTTADSAFGYFVSREAVSRVAWCYGDPGAFTALLLAAKALGDADLMQATLRGLERSLRRTFESSEVRDAGFCHGAAGLVHIARLAHAVSGETQFRELSSAWLRNMIELTPRSVAGGFLFEHPTTQEFGYDLGYLTGSIGVALVLSDFLSDTNSGWNWPLLCSL